MPRDSAAADRPASYLVGTAAAFPLFFRDRAKPINQLPFSPSAKFPKSGSSCESRVSARGRVSGDLAPTFLESKRLPACRNFDFAVQGLCAGAVDEIVTCSAAAR